MKLFLTVVLASVLMMKTAEGAEGDLNGACKTGDLCNNDKLECGTGDPKLCICKADYTATTDTPPVCKMNAGQTCTDNSECFDGTCGSDRKKCGKANDEPCTGNTQCASGNCKLTVSGSTETDKCADAGAAGVVASVLLMVATLMTSRIL